VLLASSSTTNTQVLLILTQRLDAHVLLADSSHGHQQQHTSEHMLNKESINNTSQ
jgi:hypothetical protein